MKVDESKRKNIIVEWQWMTGDERVWKGMKVDESGQSEQKEDKRGQKWI